MTKISKKVALMKMNTLWFLRPTRERTFLDRLPADLLRELIFYLKLKIFKLIPTISKRWANLILEPSFFNKISLYFKRKYIFEYPSGRYSRLWLTMDNLIHGEEKIYDKQSNKVHSFSWSYGVLHGEEQRWNPISGRKVYSCMWRDGKRDGEEQRYHPHTGRRVSLTLWKNGSIINIKRWDGYSGEPV